MHGEERSPTHREFDQLQASWSSLYIWRSRPWSAFPYRLTFMLYSKAEPGDTGIARRFKSDTFSTAVGLLNNYRILQDNHVPVQELRLEYNAGAVYSIDELEEFHLEPDEWISVFWFFQTFADCLEFFNTKLGDPA